MRWLFTTLIFSRAVFATQVALPEVEQGPWHTGTLLTPSGQVVPRGHANIEPYFVARANTGFYDRSGNYQKTKTFRSYTLIPILQVGLTSWMDIQALPVVTKNVFRGQSSLVFEDLPILVGFQLYAPASIHDWAPFIQLLIRETFPTGKYDNLNPKKKGTDIGGTGSFRTAPGISIQKFFHIRGPVFLIARTFFQYEFPSSVRVKGLNTFGGDQNTDAKILPGQSFFTSLGLELTLTKRWALACDFTGWLEKKARVSGTLAQAPAGPEVFSALPFARRFTIAPALEYNFSERLGIIGGSWFSVSGRSAARFWSAVLAVNYYI